MLVTSPIPTSHYPSQLQDLIQSPTDYKVQKLAIDGTFGTLHRVFQETQKGKLPGENDLVIKFMGEEKIREAAKKGEKDPNRGEIIPFRLPKHPNISHPLEVAIRTNLLDPEATYYLTDPAQLPPESTFWITATLSEFAAGGDLHERRLKRPEIQCRLTIEQIASIAAQLFRALDYLDKNGVVHRDVKPENLLLSRGTVPGLPQAKLTDFGFATTHRDDDKELPTEGTAEYLAPELWQRKIDQQKSSLPRTGLKGKPDLYSGGIVLYIMVASNVPFRATRSELAADPQARQKIGRKVLAFVNQKPHPPITKTLSFLKASLNPSFQEDKLLSLLVKRALDELITDMDKRSTYAINQIDAALVKAAILPPDDNK